MPLKTSLDARLEAVLLKRRHQSLYRQVQTADNEQQPQRLVNGQSVLAFCSNDYLGLASHPRVIHSLQQAANTYGVGSGAAHLISGHSYAHQQLEEALAAFTGRERALLFSTGYMANLGSISALANPTDQIYQDRLNHASLLDAAQLSAARLLRYQHTDLAHLQQRLEKHHTKTNQALIVTDGVFSMDGDCAPLKPLSLLAQTHDACLIVDDAHGFGVLGAKGAGLVEQQQLSQNQVPVLMATLGKALGTAGAFIAGSKTLIEYLIQTARPWIYTTAQPPAIAAATLTSLQVLQEEVWRREHLHSLIKQFRAAAQQLGLPLMPSETPIQPLRVDCSEQALWFSEQLRQQGIWVTAIRPPTVPAHSARLRITLSASHTAEQVDRLLEALESLFKHQNHLLT